MIAAALLTVHCFHIFFSQEARGYTVLLLLLLVSSWLFVRFTESPTRKLFRFSYPIVSALCMYAHVFAVLVLAAHWISLGVVRGRRVGWRRSLGTIAAFSVLALPMEAFALLKNKGQLNWIPPLTLKGFEEAMCAIAGYDYANVGLLVLSLGLAVTAFAVGYTSRTEKAAFAVRFVALWAVFPIAVTLLYSIHKPLFFSRYLVICVPAVLLLVAEGIAVLRGARSPFRWLWLPITVLIFSMSLRAAWRYFDAPMWPDWNSAAQWVLVNEIPGDAVCFTGNGVEPFLYYLQRNTKMGWSALPVVQNVQWINCVNYVPGTVSEQHTDYSRVWLITTDATSQQKDWINKTFVPRYGRPVQRKLFPGPITIELLPGAAS